MTKPRLKTLKSTLQPLRSPIRTMAGNGSWRDGKTTNERGYTHRWQKARAVYLRSHPLCVMCRAKGIAEVAEIVDHIVPHRGDQDLFWDEANWQSLCKPHHDGEKRRQEAANAS
jgi:5-methylcytosine-specific restriction endonuclease McrA